MSNISKPSTHRGDAETRRTEKLFGLRASASPRLIAAVLCFLCFLLFNVRSLATTVFFPIAEMTGATNDVVITVKAVNNPVIYNNSFYYFPKLGTNLTTVGGYATNSFIPGAYFVNISGLQKTWTMNVTNSSSTISAVPISVGITVYSGIQSLTGRKIEVTNDGVGNLFITDTNASGTSIPATAQANEVNVADFATPYIPSRITVGSYITNPIPMQSAGIQAAFDAAYASGGGSNTVFFPKGIWAIDTNIYVPPGISVRGLGALHAGDFGFSITRLDTNAWSLLWQTNMSRSGLVFSNLNIRGSVMFGMEIFGGTNPLAYASGVTSNSLDEVPSSMLGSGPGIFLGANTVTDWDTAGIVGTAYSGDVQIWNSTISGFKVGIRSTANSENFYRTHTVGCDVGFEFTQNCCGGDQTVWNNCSASCRPNGIGYVFANVATRGSVFISPSDYQIGTWILGTNCVVTAIGGNMEFTHPLSTRTNFVELYGTGPKINMTGTRVSSTVISTLIWQGTGGFSEPGPFGSLNNCQIEILTYTNLAMQAGVTNANGSSGPLLLSVGPYHTGGFSVSGGTAGWALSRNLTTGAPYYVWPLSEHSSFAPPMAQRIIFGDQANNNAFAGGKRIEQYGVPWIRKGTNVGTQTDPDFMTIWLPLTGAGPLAQRRFMLGDPTTSTSDDPPNALTVDAITTGNQTNTTILTKILGTDATGHHVGASLSGATWDGTTFTVTGGGGIASNAVNTLSLSNSAVVTSSTNVDFWGSPNVRISTTNRAGHGDITIWLNSIPALTGDVTTTGTGLATTIASDAVALGTDTTGNYVATIADSGASEINVVGSGAESAAVTLALASGITRDTEWNTIEKINTATGKGILTNGYTPSATIAGLANFLSNVVVGSSSTSATNQFQVSAPGGNFNFGTNGTLYLSSLEAAYLSNTVFVASQFYVSGMTNQFAFFNSTGRATGTNNGGTLTNLQAANLVGVVPAASINDLPVLTFDRSVFGHWMQQLSDGTLQVTYDGSSLTNLTSYSSVSVPMGAWFTNNVTVTDKTPASAITLTNSGDQFGFADAITNTIHCRFALPWEWNANTVKVGLRAFCSGTNASVPAAAPTNVVWGVRAAAIGDGDRIDNPTWGTVVYVTNGIGTNQFTTMEAITAALTVGNSPSRSKSILWEVFRAGAATGDTMTNSTVCLEEVRVYFKNSTPFVFPTSTP